MLSSSKVTVFEQSDWAVCHMLPICAGSHAPGPGQQERPVDGTGDWQEEEQPCLKELTGIRLSGKGVLSSTRPLYPGLVCEQASCQVKEISKTVKSATNVCRCAN